MIIRQNKTTQHAIAALSRLAEVYRDPAQWLSSGDIARSRRLRQPTVGKILTMLAQARLVVGSPGPGGGYRLARDPAQISLLDVADLFERDADHLCPYGPSWCGNHAPCPVHDSLAALRRVAEDYLRNTRLDLFATPEKAGPAAQSQASTRLAHHRRSGRRAPATAAGRGRVRRGAGGPRAR